MNPTIEDPLLPLVDIPTGMMRKLQERWKNNLIVKILGKSIGYKALTNRAKFLWKLQGDFETIDPDEGFYLINFDKKDDCQHVLTEGPWVIMNHYFTVREWEPNFKPLEAKPTSTAVWIRFPELPIEYFELKPMFRIAQMLGKPLKVDFNTAMSKRGKYARVCVQVDLAKPLVPAYMLAGKKYNAVYEFIHQLCFKCGKVGHRVELCREHPHSLVNDTNAPIMPHIVAGSSAKLPINGEAQGNGQNSTT